MASGELRPGVAGLVRRVGSEQGEASGSRHGELWHGMDDGGGGCVAAQPFQRGRHNRGAMLNPERARLLLLKASGPKAQATTLRKIANL
jgi:hypothetical protein